LKKIHFVYCKGGGRMDDKKKIVTCRMCG
jgi:hypothetical protein